MKNFGASNWKEYIPQPICDEHPEYLELYEKAWKLAFDHIKDLPGMPQNPYMDEAFCLTQVWIWDTCFMTLFCKYAREVFPGVETLNNFYEVLYGNKSLPVVIPDETEPDWTRRVVGQPYTVQVHLADNPPLFAWSEYENALMSGDKDYIKTLLYERQFLQKHYDFLENLKEITKIDGVLMRTHLMAEEKGYRWEGGCSGMDNTPRGRVGEHVVGQRPNNPEMLWIDAICQQALSAEMISRLFALIDDKENQELWYKQYQNKKDIINKYYWDEQDGFYYDIDRNTDEFYKVVTIASYWALTANIASKSQADQLLKQLRNPETLGGDVPFKSLSQKDNDYKADGQYWRGGVWLPTAYATLSGLKNYGFFKEAHEESLKLLKHMYDTYKNHEPHTIWETYSPEECKPAYNETGRPEYSRPDFCGWSALGPISVFIEYVLGFHTINAFTNTVEWAKPDTFTQKIGIKNLHFGNVVTDIEAVGNQCKVTSNLPYTLVINGKEYSISSGENSFSI